MILIQALISLGLIAWLATQIDYKPLLQSFRSVRWPLLVAVVLVSFLERIVNAWKWDILMIAKGLRIGFLALFRVQLIANFLGSFLPSSFGFDAVRIYLVSRRAGRTVDCVAAAAVDRLIMVLGTFMLSAGAVIAGAFFMPRVEVHWSVPIAAVVSVVIVLVLANAEWMRRVGALFRPLLGQRFADLAQRFYLSLHAYHGRRRAIAAAFGVTALVLLIRVAVVQLEARAFNVSVSFGALLLTVPLAWLALMLPISIGNLGLQEGAYLIALGSVGIDPVSAVAISLLEQVISRLISLPGAAFWVMGRRSDLAELDRATGST